MKKLILIILLSLLPSLAFAQTSRNPCFLNGQVSTNGIPSCESVSNTSPLPVTTSGTGSAMSLELPGGSAAISNSSGGTDGRNNTFNSYSESSFNYSFNGATWDRLRNIKSAVPDGTGVTSVAIAPISASTGGITPVVTTAAANSLVLKASAGNLYSVFAANHTATAGFIVILNATAAPADGAITPLECAALPANGNATINYNSGPPSVFSTGITAVLTSAANCFTKTTGVITGFVRGSVQ